MLAGEISAYVSNLSIVTHHTAVDTGDGLLQKFWEVEEQPTEYSSFSPEERSVVQHFKDHHSHDSDGHFIIPLPKKHLSKPLGESRSQKVRRYKSLERSLRSRGVYEEFNMMMEEYFEKKNTELVPEDELEKPTSKDFYLPMHAVYKDSSSTTKVHAVFDASALSSTAVALNNNLLVGPTVYSSLVDVLISLHLHRIALTTDISRMYRMVLLEESDKDLHRFVWKINTSVPLHDYRMT